MNNKNISDVTSIRKFASTQAEFWYPEKADFRIKYNQLFQNGLCHALNCGDFTVVSVLIKNIPQDQIKKTIIKKCEAAFYIAWDEGAETFKKSKTLTLQISQEKIDNFKALDTPKATAINPKSDFIIMEKITLSNVEFVDYILDTIVLNRDAFTVDDLEQIEQTLTQIQRRLRKQPQN